MIESDHEVGFFVAVHVFGADTGMIVAEMLAAERGKERLHGSEERFRRCTIFCERGGSRDALGVWSDEESSVHCFREVDAETRAAGTVYWIDEAAYGVAQFWIQHLVVLTAVEVDAILRGARRFGEARGIEASSIDDHIGSNRVRASGEVVSRSGALNGMDWGAIAKLRATGCCVVHEGANERRDVNDGYIRNVNPEDASDCWLVLPYVPWRNDRAGDSLCTRAAEEFEKSSHFSREMRYVARRNDHMHAAMLHADAEGRAGAQGEYTPPLGEPCLP